MKRKLVCSDVAAAVRGTAAARCAAVQFAASRSAVSRRAATADVTKVATAVATVDVTAAATAAAVAIAAVAVVADVAVARSRRLKVASTVLRPPPRPLKPRLLPKPPRLLPPKASFCLGVQFETGLLLCGSPVFLRASQLARGVAFRFVLLQSME